MGRSLKEMVCEIILVLFSQALWILGMGLKTALIQPKNINAYKEEFFSVTQVDKVHIQCFEEVSEATWKLRSLEGCNELNYLYVPHILTPRWWYRRWGVSEVIRPQGLHPSWMRLVPLSQGPQRALSYEYTRRPDNQQPWRHLPELTTLSLRWTASLQNFKK